MILIFVSNNNCLSLDRLSALGFQLAGSCKKGGSCRSAKYISIANKYQKSSLELDPEEKCLREGDEEMGFCNPGGLVVLEEFLELQQCN